MYEKRLVLFIVLLFLSFVFTPASASASAKSKRSLEDSLKKPAEGHIQILYMKNGSRFVGSIVKIAEDKIRFETNVGTLDIDIPKIKKILEVPETAIKNGKYWFPDPNHTRLYFAPTGRTLGKGNGFFHDIYLFFPGFAYGVTDFLDIGGGVSIFPGVDAENQLFYLAPKVGLGGKGNFHLAAGAFILSSPSFMDEGEGVFTALYAAGTVGPPGKSFTLGLGYARVGDGWGDKPLVFVGGDFRLSRRLSFVTENWLIPGLKSPLLSYGFRFFSRKMTVDLAFYNIVGEGSFFPGFPYIAFVYSF